MASSRSPSRGFPGLPALRPPPPLLLLLLLLLLPEPGGGSESPPSPGPPASEGGGAPGGTPETTPEAPGGAAPPHPAGEDQASPPRAPACGQRMSRITGGLPAAEKRWPWQVSLQVSDYHVCGGTLIASRWVLTAAHCIYGHLEYIVKLGDTNLNRKSTTAAVVPVQDIVIHQDYTPMGTLTHDIALALLAFPVNYSSHIQPICLPEKAFPIQTDTQCWVTGWGKLKESDGDDVMPKRLHEAQLDLVDYKTCNKVLKRIMLTRKDVVKRGMICGYSPRGKDSCQGDSGGPLVCDVNGTWTQVGIVSWGIGCGRRGYPGVYTEVSFYRKWVIQQMSRAPPRRGPAGGPLLWSSCLTLHLAILAGPVTHP